MTPMRLQGAVLCGGASRRMGQDKAALPHPNGGSWLSHAAALLSQVCPSVAVCSQHSSHADLIAALERVALALEPTPAQGPLHALQLVLPKGNDSALLVAPVDMPQLNRRTLDALIAQWRHSPSQAAVAHDGERLQPLLGIYPGGPEQRNGLAAVLASGERRWQAWLATIPHQAVVLPAAPLINANTPAERARLMA